MIITVINGQTNKIVAKLDVNDNLQLIKQIEKSSTPKSFGSADPWIGYVTKEAYVINTRSVTVYIYVGDIVKIDP